LAVGHELSEDLDYTRGLLARASVRAATAGGDPEARECVSLAVRDRDDRVILQAVEAAEGAPPQGMVADLHQAHREATNAYRRMVLGYGLRCLDPEFKEPNLIWDVRELKAALQSTRDAAERAKLQKSLADTERALKALGGK
jgi:hypothetical protein